MDTAYSTHLTNSMKFCVNFPTNCSYPTKGSAWDAGMETLCPFQSAAYFSISVPQSRLTWERLRADYGWSGGPQQLHIASCKG